MRSELVAIVLVLGGGLTLGGCKHVSLQKRPVAVEHDVINASNGLRYVDLFLGEGPAATAADLVTFDYTAWLQDGTWVDSTLDRGVPLAVKLEDAPLAGLALGIAGMRAQGRRRLVVPPELAYGTQGVEDMIPPDATLEFEVHLIEVVPAER